MKGLTRYTAPVIAAGLAVVLTGARAQAQNANEAGRYDQRIVQAVARHESRILELRHQIHRNPELGNREVETARLVSEHLQALGVDVQTGIAHTGVVGILTGGRPGPTIAVRADMDALPVTEETDLSFRSTVRSTYNNQDVGVMHACGHDVHTAVQLGVASVLADMRDEMPGTIMFIFQPAEEGPPPGEEGGAMLMLKEGVFAERRPEAVFGLHTLAEMGVGELGYTAGPAFAAVDHFRITLTGVQTHGAAPHLGVDPVVMASEVVAAFQTIPSRTLNPLEPSVVTVGMIHGGERFNIIPAQVRLEGTVRSYNPTVRETVERRMNEILAGVTAAHGGRYTLAYDRGTPSLRNDPELSAATAPSLAVAVGKGNVVQLPPTMGGEDFALFANEVPGFFYRLGVSSPGAPSGPHHSPTFRADDEAVPIGMRAMANVLLDYLTRSSGQ